MRITEELFLLTQAIAKHQVEYAVCGGLAVAIHGRPRLTLDIDFLVPATQMERAIEAAVGVGFDDVLGWMPLPGNDCRIDRLFRINKIRDGEILSLALFEICHAENPLFGDRETFDIEGHSMQFLLRASLTKMKESSKRWKDQLNVKILNDRADEG